jgi:hypothetical protein
MLEQGRLQAFLDIYRWALFIYRKQKKAFTMSALPLAHVIHNPKYVSSNPATNGTGRKYKKNVL